MRFHARVIGMVLRSMPATAVGLFLSVCCVATAVAQQVTPELYSGLNYRFIGPPGNRTSAVVGVPGDPIVYYFGAASGGIWKAI